MSSADKEKKIAIKKLHLALKALSAKEKLPLRERAMVLEAIDKIEAKQYESPVSS